MVDHFCDWQMQIASVALSIVTSFMLASLKTDSECKLFTTTVLKCNCFIYKNGDNFNTEVSEYIFPQPNTSL